MNSNLKRLRALLTATALSALLLALLAACGATGDGNILKNPYRCDTSFTQTAQTTLLGKVIKGGTDCEPPSTVVFTFDTLPHGFQYTDGHGVIQRIDYNGDSPQTATETLTANGETYIVSMVLTITQITPTPSNATPLPEYRPSLKMTVDHCGDLLHDQFSCPTAA